MSAEQYITAPSYQSLIDMIKVYLNRKDQATVDAIPFFINAAEKVILRKLRIPSLERIVTFNASNINDGFVNLPSDLIELKHVWINGKRKGTLERVPMDRLLRGSPDTPYDKDSSSLTYGDNDYDYNVGYFAITGTRMYLTGIEDDDEILLTYYYDVPELGPETVSNVLLDLAPDAFLYLAVSEGFKFLMEPERSQYYEQNAYMRLDTIQEQADNAEWSGSPLTVSPI